jgi:hypothetical protein
MAEASDILFGRGGKERQILAEITAGYAFRHCVDYWNQLFTDINLVFDSAGFSFSKMDSQKHTINHFILYRFSYYLFNHEDDELTFGLKVEALRQITQGIQRRQGLRIVKYKINKKFFIPIVGADGVPTREKDHIPPKRLSETRIDMKALDPKLFRLVCNVPVLRFHTMLQSFCKMKVPSDNLYAEVKVYEAGLRFRLSDALKSANKCEYFGTIPDATDEDEDEDEEEPTAANIFYIRKQVLKAMVKLNNTCSNGCVIPVYYCEGKPILLVWPFENLGEQRIYIKSCPPS